MTHNDISETAWAAPGRAQSSNDGLLGSTIFFILYLVMMGYQRLQRIPVLTSVSETIRKPPLAEASNALGKQKNTAKNDFTVALGL